MVPPELTRQSIQRRLGSFTTSASRVWYPATASVWAASLWRRVASCCAALRARRRSSAALCSSRAVRSDFCRAASALLAVQEGRLPWQTFAVSLRFCLMTLCQT